MNNIKWLGHSTIKLNGSKIIYIDPFSLNKNYGDADLIFCTHSHYDHFSPEDILKVKNDNTSIIVVKENLKDALELGFDEDKIVTVEPNQKYEVEGITFETTPSYNMSKQFHPKEKLWVGYNINFDDSWYYVAGDTDNIPELDSVKTDIGFFPVGGTYTMNGEEAANLANTIKPKIAIPIHYGSIVGDKEDAENFIRHLDSSILGRMF